MAPVKRAAAAFGQEATQAPQPMQAAASMARSASGLGTRIAFASAALPVRVDDVAARGDDAVEGGAIDDEVAQHRERRRAPRLEPERVAVLEVPHVQLAHGRVAERAVGLAVDEEAAHAADALAAVASRTRRGPCPPSTSRWFSTSSISRKDMCSLTSGTSYRSKLAGVARVLLPPDVEGDPHL